MLHRVVVLFLVVTILSLVPYAAHAQSDRPGYWDNGRWIGYRPAHLKYAGQQGRPVERTATNPGMANSGESVPESHRVAPGTNSSSAMKANRSQGVVPTAFEEAGPVEIGDAPMGYPQEPWNGDCGGPQCGCTGQDDCCVMPCYPCRPRFFWVRAEYLGWWKQGMKLPALVATNPSAAPSTDNPNTTILFGDDTVNKDGTSGGRFSLGMWIDPCRSHGIEFTYMGLGSETTSYHASSDNYTILGRPFFNIETAAADADLISYPSPAYSGWVNVVAETNLQGTELLYRRTAKRYPHSQVDFMVGWRWLQLKDELRIRESVASVGGTIALADQFNTKNNFHGAEFGIQWQRPISHQWTFEILGKAAIGNSRSVVTIAGQQTGEASQGLLALDSNSGTHTQNSFSAITEFGLSMKRRFQCGIEASFGYTLVYWGDVMRAGDQVDLNVDPRQIPPNAQNSTHPQALMNTTDFWTQGLHCGLKYAF